MVLPSLYKTPRRRKYGRRWWWSVIASLLTFKAALAALLASNLVFVALWRRAAVSEVNTKRSVAIAHRAYRDETKHLHKEDMRLHREIAALKHRGKLCAERLLARSVAGTSTTMVDAMTAKGIAPEAMLDKLVDEETEAHVRALKQRWEGRYNRTGTSRRKHTS